MAMSIANLKTELLNLGLYDNEPDSILAWAAAWRAYFTNATTNGIPIVGAGLAVPEIAMAGAMTGLSITGAAAISAGISAFWASLILPINMAICWPGSIGGVLAPGIAGIAAALGIAFTANTVGELSKDASMTSIATAVHPLNLGGFAIFPGPVQFPIL